MQYWICNDKLANDLFSSLELSYLFAMCVSIKVRMMATLCELFKMIAFFVIEEAHAHRQVTAGFS